MQKTLPLLCAFLLASLFSTAQTCVRDSSLLQKPDSVRISPLPYTQAHQVYGLWAACINEPYLQSVTLKVPPTFTYQGTALTLTSATVATTGAVSGLPTGLTYKCDPPNCVFLANTLGCVLIYGTPNNPAQAPDTVELKIAATVAVIIPPSIPFSFPLSFPDPTLAPGNYYLMVRSAGTCTSSAYDFGSPITSVKNTPNPFDQMTLIEVESGVVGGFHFEVLNLMGQRVHSQMVELSTGVNQFTFDAGKLPNGTYYYSLSNSSGKVSKMLMVSR